MLVKLPEKKRTRKVIKKSRALRSWKTGGEFQESPGQQGQMPPKR